MTVKRCRKRSEDYKKKLGLNIKKIKYAAEKRRQIVRISNFTRGSSHSSKNETSFRKEIMIQGKSFFLLFYFLLLLFFFNNLHETKSL